MDTDKTVLDLGDGMKITARQDTILITYDNPEARELTEEELTAIGTIYKLFCAMDPQDYKEAVNGQLH